MGSQFLLMILHYWKIQLSTWRLVKDDRCPVIKKLHIVCLHKYGKSNSVIATTVGRSRSAVQRIAANFKSSGTKDAKPKTGRPRKTLPRQDRIMIRMSLKDRFKSATEISHEFGYTSDVNVSRKTVSRRLQVSELLAHAPAKKPLISKKNQRARLHFCN
ncbi:uncharacterized protein LOC115217893 [Octopus sinensis]|uniref:Uncharacterized protein LOC115217893 n=1 Tax=Octopus sinensis TaxID=2607531 RepID=A0A6P7SZ83_9MOLL|nr:uncharacterized protein LOC115217893 [Octopus sinensis]